MPTELPSNPSLLQRDGKIVSTSIYWVSHLKVTICTYLLIMYLIPEPAMPLLIQPSIHPDNPPCCQMIHTHPGVFHILLKALNWPERPCLWLRMTLSQHLFISPISSISSPITTLPAIPTIPQIISTLHSFPLKSHLSLTTSKLLPDPSKPQSSKVSSNISSSLPSSSFASLFFSSMLGRWQLHGQVVEAFGDV
ncbi:hypothetical protein JAAARDRAFT_198023 [Jaapia argillacea MUCL 33604]|uniref:Uncharacterized protein n=1 Tax=Jaapia argillacea MUCL 33604 TaxID=933084 RepID=A0A067PQS2_9AGAM|nr:hypothetical protein JAAARDRAFT_198023 [Jaapia argillacea MUCL 33604]